MSSREKEKKNQVQSIKNENQFSLPTATLGVSIRKSNIFKLQKKMYF